LRACVFLDRDGTIVEDPGHLSDPAAVVLTPGAAGALRRLAQAGFALVVVSNQAGVSRGLYPESAVVAVNDRIASLLAAERASLDAWYWCPHHPDFTGPCACRKPEPGMLLDASEQLGLDLTSSWLVGDHETDLEAARRAGVRSMLVLTGHGERAAARLPPDSRVPVVADLREAANRILEEKRGSPEA
jgi:D-glycero-D-manno-heptose 1,7-bisphosphate phosphatase